MKHSQSVLQLRDRSKDSNKQVIRYGYLVLMSFEFRFEIDPYDTNESEMTSNLGSQMVTCKSRNFMEYSGMLRPSNHLYFIGNFVSNVGNKENDIHISNMKTANRGQQSNISQTQTVTPRNINYPPKKSNCPNKKSRKMHQRTHSSQFSKPMMVHDSHGKL